MLIDTHAHLNFNAYKGDADEVIRRSLNGGIWMINVGSQYETSKRAVEIAQKYSQGVWAAVGLHPIHVREEESKSIDSFPPSFSRAIAKGEEESLLSSLSLRENSVFDYEKYKELAKSPKVVAIGEIGLDYKSEYVLFKEKQKEVFLKQLDLTINLNLPVIFHCRFAHDDLIEILKNHLTIEPFSHLRGVIHCFTGNWEQAEKYLETGFYLGFNGIIFKLNLDEIIEKTPLERILIETDCPYLTPPISVNQRLYQRKSAVIRNEPLYVKYIAEKIAKIKNLTFEKVSKITTKNAKALFKI